MPGKKGKALGYVSIPKVKELFQAVRDNDDAQVRHLVKREKVPVNVVDEEDRRKSTPLLLAAMNENLDIVRTLIKAKPPADVNAEDKYGKKAIYFAANYGNGQLARLLCFDADQKIETNYLDRESGKKTHIWYEH